MSYTSNRKQGNSFEEEFCELLSSHGFWCHNMAQNAAGQPADVIAARNGNAYLIDCKVCTNGKFQLSRMEENQVLAMKCWRESDNGDSWFALRMPDDEIYLLSLSILELFEGLYSKLSTMHIRHFGILLEDWVK